MSLLNEQYLALAQLSYHDFEWPTSKDRSIQWLLENYSIEHEGEPVFSGLSGLSDWEIVSFQSNTDSGFAAVAFKKPDGEIVFAFRGTEPNASLGEALKDFYTDIQIGANGVISGRPNQFADAEAFVQSVRTNYPGAAYSFTGHSLGGGLAQYMTYRTHAASVTFNAVGIGQLLPIGTNLGSYAVTDHVNHNDIIGNYGLQLGHTEYHQDINGPQISQQHALGAVAFLSPTAASLAVIGSLPSSSHYAFGAHGMDTILTPAGNGSYALTSPASGGSPAQIAASILYGMSVIAPFIGEIPGFGIFMVASDRMAAFRTVANTTTAGIYYIGDSLGGAIYYVGTNFEDWIPGTDTLADAAFNIMRFTRDVFTNGLDIALDLFTSAAAAAPARVDPLILDLDGDGIETTNLVGSTTHFDLDANGFAERTGWVKGDDGLLVLDRDGNGKITNGQELFGDHTVLRSGMVATSGFQALAEFDSNSDGVITTNDAIYASLRVWRDVNGDGVSATSELKTLSELNIASLSLSSTATQVTDVMNNIQRRLGSFSLTNGTTRALGEYLLNRDTGNSQENITETLPLDILVLPNVQGSGNVSSLHLAMAHDTTGQLQQLVEDFMAASDVATRNTLLAQILYKWAGVDTVDPASRGANIDARQLTALERFLGTGFIGTSGTTPNTTAAPILQRAYAELSERVYAALISNTSLQTLAGKIGYESGALDLSLVISELDTQLTADPASGLVLLSEFSRLLKGYGLAGEQAYVDFRQYFASQSTEYASAIDAVGARAVAGDASDNTLATGDLITTVSGGAGNDTITSGTGDDTLYGNTGNDVLSGNNGNDTLSGGTGNDSLYGGNGNDTYIFTRGDGQDRIHDDSGINVIKFGAGISPNDVRALRVVTTTGPVSANLELTIAGTTDKLIVVRYFGAWSSYGGGGIEASPQNMVKEIIFADGTVWSQDTIYAKVHDVTGTSGDDTITGYDIAAVTFSGLDGNDTLTGQDGNDTLYGDAGDDRLYGNNGQDTLAGGTGNDRLDGGTGNDTYIFNRGDGQDKINESGGIDIVRFGAGITPADILVKRVTTTSNTQFDLELSIIGTTDKLTVLYHMGSFSYNDYRPSPLNMIEQVIFADGTIWDQAILNEKAHTLLGSENNDSLSTYDSTPFTLYGFAGDDTLEGSSSNDTLVGGTGNDQLSGNAGNDTYVFNIGDGQDTIRDTGNTDTVRFGTGITAANIQITRAGTYKEDLVISIANTTDTLRIRYFFGIPSSNSLSLSDSYKIEQFTFADGTIWNATEILAKASVVTGTESGETLQGFNYLADVMYGLGGNDTLNGYDGNDTLVGGAGNDTLNGSSGDDTYLYTLGDGQDTILEGWGNDTIRLVNILPANVSVTRNGTYGEHLILAIDGSTDKLTINNYFGSVVQWYGYTPSDASKIEKIVFADGTIWDVATIVEKLRTITGTEGDDTALNGYDNQSKLVYGLGGNDTITTNGGNDYIEAGAGNDTVNASSGNDTLIGGAGNDILIGNTGDDILDGGVGNDDVRGNEGNDVYKFRLGDGQDTLSDYQNGVNADRIEFGTGILPENVTISRTGGSRGQHLTLSINGTTDKLTVNNYFGWVNGGSFTPMNEYKIEQVVFADGTIWDTAFITERARYVTGTEAGDSFVTGYYDQDDIIYGLGGNDALYGYDGNDTLYGGAGNDTLSSANGNDFLDGGAGNDNLWGDLGDDTYIFRVGDGQDVISDYSDGANTDKVQFGSGILPSDIRASRSGNEGTHLLLTINGTGDQLTINNFFGSISYSSFVASDRNKVEQFVFADGTIWDVPTVVEKARTIIGTQGNDTSLRGFNNQADLLYGLGGDDYIVAYGGNDYIEAGDGNDSAYGGEGDDTVFGGAGNDTLYGEAGIDILDGGTGNDLLYGGSGNDTYVFNTGYGTDTFTEGSSSNGDKALVGSPLESLIFARSGNNLNVTIAGTSDTIIVSSWYSGQDYQIEQFRASDGSTISNAQIEQLIQAMASWSSNHGGTSWSQALSSNQQDVQAILSQYWTAPTA